MATKCFICQRGKGLSMQMITPEIFFESSKNMGFDINNTYFILISDHKIGNIYTDHLSTSVN
jgi:hypothetical protein